MKVKCTTTKTLVYTEEEVRGMVKETYVEMLKDCADDLIQDGVHGSNPLPGEILSFGLKNINAQKLVEMIDWWGECMLDCYNSDNPHAKVPATSVAMQTVDGKTYVIYNDGDLR